jgi:hypothetical protein
MLSDCAKKVMVIDMLAEGVPLKKAAKLVGENPMIVTNWILNAIADGAITCSTPAIEELKMHRELRGLPGPIGDPEDIRNPFPYKKHESHYSDWPPTGHQEKAPSMTAPDTNYQY